MIDYSLYLVTDDPSRYAGNWLDNVRAAVDGGVTCVQYRDTESPPDERLRRVRALRDALGRRVPIIINNEPELAVITRAEGVHVGQKDLPPKFVREIVGTGCEIGLSITDRAQVASVPWDVVDALGIGPVFDARKTKADAAEAMGPAGFAKIVCEVKLQITDYKLQIADYKLQIADHKLQIADHKLQSAKCKLQSANCKVQSTAGAQDTADIPCIAIGGITLANAAAVLRAGARGLAVVSAFSKSPDPFVTARQFRAFFK